MRGVKTRNGLQWTEARFFGFIRGALRKAFLRWPQRQAAKNRAKVIDAAGKPKWVCADCSQLFMAKDTEVDHVVPCGSCNTFADLPGFVERMFCEADGFQILCKPCHLSKTNKSRSKKA